MQPETLTNRSVSHNRRDVKYTRTIKGVLLTDADVARFWSKVKRGDGCWLWRGSVNSANGYGQFGVTGPGAHGKYKVLTAHRVVWTLSHGAIPDGQSILHHCDVPTCVNPAHLFLGTHRMNIEDAARKGRLHGPRRTPPPALAWFPHPHSAGVTKGYIWQIVHRRGSSALHRKVG